MFYRRVLAATVISLSLAAALLAPSLASLVRAGPDYAGINNHVDGRFEWESHWIGYEDGSRVYLYWHDGVFDQARDDDHLDFLVQEYNSAAWAAKMRTEILLDVKVDHTLHVYLYENREDMSLFLNDPEWRVGGFTIDRDTVLVNTENFPMDTMKHEIAHLVLFEALWYEPHREYKDAPLWLHEGVAQLAEYFFDFYSFSLSDLRAWVEDGGELLPVCAMLEYPDDEVANRNFYGKSLVVTSLLLQEGGVETFASFVAKINRGWDIRWAMNADYGFTDHGLEEKWLEYAGLPGPAVRCEY